MKLIIVEAFDAACVLILSRVYPISTVLGNLAEKAEVNEYIIIALTMISNFVLEYLFTRYVVYRNSCDTIEPKEKEDTAGEEILQSEETSQEETPQSEEKAQREDNKKAVE